MASTSRTMPFFTSYSHQHQQRPPAPKDPNVSSSSRRIRRFSGQPPVAFTAKPSSQFNVLSALASAGLQSSDIPAAATETTPSSPTTAAALDNWTNEKMFAPPVRKPARKSATALQFTETVPSNSKDEESCESEDSIDDILSLYSPDTSSNILEILPISPPIVTTTDLKRSNTFAEHSLPKETTALQRSKSINVAPATPTPTAKPSESPPPPDSPPPLLSEAEIKAFDFMFKNMKGMIPPPPPPVPIAPASQPKSLGTSESNTKSKPQYRKIVAKSAVSPASPLLAMRDDFKRVLARRYYSLSAKKIVHPKRTLLEQVLILSVMKMLEPIK
ncbi:hypothetical protein BJ741DRAFT_634667 [Chytriomyces cf. hyalinus JEL632]|nr:hypothetical protein BJ741DRAFT_634667 [Chytriomyces cf. hyalinus JEL632]